MAQISYIPYKDIQEAKRFDADYFKPKYLRESHILARLKTITVGDLSFVTDGQHGYHEIDENSPISHLTAKNAKKWFADKIDADKLAKWVDDSNKRSSLEEDDIILSTRGSVGYCAIVTKEVLPANIDQDVARIKINLEKRNLISPSFLLAYLNSCFGQNWILKNSSGMVQQGMSLEKVRNIKIPILAKQFQEKITDIVSSAYFAQTKSKQLYKEAEELLLRELGLLDHETKHTLSFSTTKKYLDEAGRIDAEYFQPKYREIIEKIEKYGGGFDTVKNMFTWKKGFEIGAEAYQETGLPFVRVSDFSINGIEDVGKRISEQAYSELKEAHTLKKGEILFTKDGTIGLSAVLGEDFDGVLSSAFLRLKLKNEYKNYEKECLSLIFNSPICRMQVEKLSGGAIIAHLKPSDFEKFRIPLIKPEIQKQIADKVQESHSLRKESKNLLEEAKRKVEEEIERGVK